MQDQMKEVLEIVKILNTKMKKMVITDEGAFDVWLFIRKKKKSSRLLKDEELFEKLKKHKCR